MNCATNSAVQTITINERTHLSIEHSIRRLDKTCVAIEEDRAEKPDLLHGVRLLVLPQRNPVADVVRVLDEQEDDTREDFGQATADKQLRPRRRDESVFTDIISG